MVFPAIAAQTFEKFKSDLFFRKIYKSSLKKIKSLKTAKKRADFAHGEINKKIEELFQDPTIEGLVNCHKGCSACCHTQVSVTQDEASVLAERVIDGLSIDWTKLFLQSKAGNSSEDFYKLDYSMRGCIFLGDKGECRVYESRPSVCRTNYVVSDPENCKTVSGGKNSVSLLKTYEADMVTYSFFDYSKRSGALASMIWNTLNRLGKSKPTLLKNTPHGELDQEA